MAWKDIPGKQYWQFKDDPELKVLDYLSRATSRRNPTITNNGVRTLPNGRQVYVQTRYVGPGSTDTDTTNRGEIDVNFHLASIGNAGVKPASFFSALPAVGGGGGGGTDPDFANVSALFKTPNSGSISDVTGNLGNVITVDTAIVDAAETKFQPANINLSSNGQLEFPYNTRSALDFGTGTYTVEAWIYRTAIGSVGTDTTYQNILSTRTSGQGGWSLVLNNSDGRLAWQTGSGSVLVPSIVGNYAAVPFDTWTHVAVSRQNTGGGGFRFFVNGFARDFTNPNTDNTSSDGTDNFVIGGDNSDSYTRFRGYIEDVRITKGVTRYTADFTPPTAEFPTS